MRIVAWMKIRNYETHLSHFCATERQRYISKNDAEGNRDGQRVEVEEKVGKLGENCI